MTTTFEEFAGTQAGNYCTLPKNDVEILPEIHHCKDCGVVIVWEKERGAFGWGEYVHTEETACSYASPRAFCRYCHAEDGVKTYQRAWSDDVECERCGGVKGYPLGD
jgi:hypothetical protein